MRSYNKIIALTLSVIVVIFAVVNITPLFSKEEADIHDVEISRVAREIENSGEIPDKDNYSTISGIYKQGDEEDFFISDNNYVIREINGELYRIEYFESSEKTHEMLYLNIALAVVSLLVLGVLFYIRHNIVKPFDKITSLPYELAKGNLTIPLKENKNRYFGKFLW